MTFAEEFPSLAMEFKEFDDLNYNLFGQDEIQEHCLDKQRVKKKFYRLKQLLNNKRFQKIELLNQIELIEKELGLEDKE